MDSLGKDSSEFIWQLRAITRSPLLPVDWERSQPRDSRAILQELCRQELTAKQRQVIRLCVFEGLSVSQAALQLNVNKSTVSRHLQNAKRRLERAVRYAAHPLSDRPYGDG